MAATKNHNQVVVLTKPLRSGKHLKQSWDVLAVVGATNRQQGRSLGVAQERSYQGMVGNFRCGSHGMKQGRIHTGGNHRGSIWPELVIAGVLVIEFVLGTGNHQLGLGQGPLLGFNSAR